MPDLAVAADLATPSDLATNPLVGTWFDQITPVISDNQTVTLTLSANGSYTLVHSQVNAMNAQTKAGCTETISDQGTWSANATNITITPTAAMSGLVADTNCASAMDNGAGMPVAPIVTGTVGYTVNGNTLTVMVGGMPAVFTKK